MKWLTAAEAVATSVNTTNSLSQDYTSLDDHTSQTSIDTPRFKPFTSCVFILFNLAMDPRFHESWRNYRTFFVLFSFRNLNNRLLKIFIFNFFLFLSQTEYKLSLESRKSILIFLHHWCKSRLLRSVVEETYLTLRSSITTHRNDVTV